MKKGLVLNPAEPHHPHVGSGVMTAKYGSIAINSSGDWTPYKALDKHQSNAVFDTDCCWIFNSLKAWVMLANIQGFDDFPKDLAERFISVMANASPEGGDPWHAGTTFIQDGCVPGSALPFLNNIDNWSEWAHPNPMDSSFISLAKALLDKFEPD